MSDLLWPGDHRAGDTFSDAAVLAAMVRVEEVWLAALVVHDVAPADAAVAAGGLARLLGDGAREEVSVAADGAGNPVVGLVALLRRLLEDAGEPAAARWLHRGLTSQDVVDTGLMLCARGAVSRTRRELRRQIGTLVATAAEHRDTVMAGRTLTQHAVPTTFGLKAAGWLAGLLDADDDLAALRFPLQVGGAAGTLAGPVRLAGDADRARACVQTTAAELGLVEVAPWHTRRRPVTKVGDALVGATDVWGHLARDVLTLARPEVGEVTESGGGGSSTMPGKANPVRAVLLHRAAQAAPGHGAQLHLAAAGQVDERADGAWQVEWDALRTLARRTVVAAGHATELLAGLEVHAEAMSARVASLADTLTAEQRALGALAGHRSAGGQADHTDSGGPTGYLGLAGPLVDAVVERAVLHLRREETP